MTRTERMSVALIVAILVATLAMLPVTADRAFLVLTGLLVLFSAILDTLARRLGAGHLIATLVQVIPGVALWFGVVGRDPWPLIDDVWAYVVESRPPMEPHDGFRLLSSIGLWVLFLVCEILANALEQPAWTAPVLLTPYLVPALGMRDDAPIWYAAFPLVAYLIVLFVDASERHRRATGRPRWLTLAATSTVVGAAALGLALGATPLVPVGSPWWTLAGDGPGTVVMNDPSLDLVRNLQATSARPLLRYTTDAPGGVYLRMAALPLADENGFHLTATSLMPLRAWTPDGTADAGGPAEYGVSVTVGDFASEWLPAPQQATGFAVPGMWSFDPLTHNVMASGDVRRSATLNLAYSAQFVVRPQDSGLDLDGFEPGDPGDDGLTAQEIPLVTTMRDQALAVTADATDAGQQARALIAWFHSDAFTYDTTQAAGTTQQTMEKFLFDDHVGYCEQFAGGMALMARALGIPARVVVGFLPGSKQADGSYLVTTMQMHAWTELYLARDTVVDGRAVHEEGWYRFDPTPPAAVGLPPDPVASATPTVKATPTPTPRVTRSAAPTSAPPTAAPTGPGSDASAAAAWRTGLTALGIVLAAAAVAVTPRVVRTLRRLRRIPGHGSVASRVEDAWDELRDCVVDAGRRWPSGTPRQVAQTLAADAGDHAEQLDALAISVERARFARPTDDVPDPLLAIHELRKAWTARSTRLQRMWPRSVFRR